jgi:hypothetical protein
MFLCVYITENLTCSNNPTTLVKRLQQHLYFLRWPRKIIKSVLTSCITAWYMNHSVHDCYALQRVVKTAWYITGTVLPPIQDNYSKQCLRKAPIIIR